MQQPPRSSLFPCPTLSPSVGAVPGAIPPMMGVAAAAGELTVTAWLLFAILFVWQMPHFLAIAILYRDDYRSEEHTSELQSRQYLVCRLLLETKKRLCILIL